MLQRKWIPNDKVIESESKITFYDAGSYFCEMVGPSHYGCWEVVSRETTDNTVTEVLKPAPEDWIPFDIISTESYSVNQIEGGYEITGWTITDLIQPLFEPQQPSQQHPQQQRPPPQLLQRPSQRGGQQQGQLLQRSSQQQGRPRRPFQPLPQLHRQSSELPQQPYQLQGQPPP